MRTIQITLPDELAQQAERAGLLSSKKLERWLRDQLREQRVAELFEAMERMAGVSEPHVMSADEIARELDLMRRERCASPKL